MKQLVCITLAVIMMTACNKSTLVIPHDRVLNLEKELQTQYPDADTLLMNRGIEQVAALWRTEDGSADDFTQFVKEHYCGTDDERLALFESLSRVLENCFESADKLTVELLRPTQLTNATDPQVPDWIMSAYSPLAHFSDDMFANKLAFITILNFPHFRLDEKNRLGHSWSRKQWAMARMGDVFTTRVPSEVNSRLAQAFANAENYIADYNIHTQCLLTDDGRQLWNENKVLLSHWNLRDELKGLYADSVRGQEKQEMIYQVMQRIVRQEIPQQVINSDKHRWKPYANTVEGEVFEREPYTRYERILEVANAFFEEDKNCPLMPSAITRNFEEGVEIPAQELDSLFRTLLGSEQVQKVAGIIRQRLGRDLRPFDIWYDGFKTRSTLNEDSLSKVTRGLYPNAEAFAADMPRLLQSLGFEKNHATEIASHIAVEPARGSGHAWPCLGRNEQARLRTRIAQNGMDYKGYNIAVHEFGHCVEEVLDMYYIDYYMLAGVPNTAYTEASAFLWQNRDLQLLPKPTKNVQSHAMETLDHFWSMYEIMGVSLVDMAMWQWIYAHPKATAKELCEQTVAIAKDVWNRYYEHVLGEHDCVLLGIYSHMVNSPMYLPNYPLGHIVQYQIEEHLANYKNKEAFAKEYERIYRLGKLTPKEWMIQAVGTPPSVEPILKKIDEVCEQRD